MMSDYPETHLRRTSNGGVIAIGGPIDGALFGPSTRKLQLGTGEVYELIPEAMPEPYEEPTTSPEKPMVVTKDEVAAYDAETEAIEAAKPKPVEPTPAFTPIVVVDTVDAQSADEQGGNAGDSSADGESVEGDSPADASADTGDALVEVAVAADDAADDAAEAPADAVDSAVGEVDAPVDAVKAAPKRAKPRAKSVKGS